MNHTFLFDITSRLNPAMTEYEKKPYNEHRVPITRYHVDQEDYDRPFWVAPDLSDKAGNNFAIITIIEQHLSKLGYIDEAKEFREIALNGMVNKKMNLYQIINKFVNYTDSISSKVIDGDKYIKINPQPAHVLQIKEFKNVTLNSIKKLHANQFDFSTTNTYGRDILFYVQEKAAIEWLFENVFDTTKERDYLRLFSLDEFQTSLLIKHKNLEITNYILEKMLEKEDKFHSLIHKWCTGVDSFSRCIEDPIVTQLNQIFAGDTNLNEYCELTKKNAKVISTLARVYPEFAQSIISRGDTALKDNKEKLAFWRTCFEKEYFEYSLKEKVDSKNITSTKSLKI